MCVWVLGISTDFIMMIIIIEVQCNCINLRFSFAAVITFQQTEMRK